MIELRHGDDAEHDACAQALGQVQAFLHGELPESDADLVRMHLDACEKCFENFDVEQTISNLLRRCNRPERASQELRMRIVSMAMYSQPPQ